MAFSTQPENFCSFVLTSTLLSADVLNLGGYNFLFGKGLTLSQTIPVFMCLQYKSFENTLGKGEIARHEQFLLFPQCFRHEQFLLFPTVFSTCLPTLFAIFIKSKVVVCKLFQFGIVYNSSFGKGLKHLQMTNYKYPSKNEENMVKRKKCCFPSISPFPTMFPKDLAPKVIKTWHW